ncbi:MAG: fused MFS/spermidine synthase [Ignavibacteriaceae bacterium]
MALTNDTRKSIFAILFVISGAAGLIYQIVWFKYLGLFLGNTTHAQMIVLATFLGGLAAGNFVIGKRADALKNPARFYSFLEIGIGLYCLLYPTLSVGLGELFLKTAGNYSIESTSFLFYFFRFLLAALLLFIPTFAMGGTLPALSKFFVDDLKFARRDTAVLYFLNSFGAVIGVLFAGFLLIKEFGLPFTIYVTAAINLFIGLLGFIASLNYKQDEALNEAFLNSTEQKEIDLSKKTLFIVLATAGSSGLAALLYEMVWVRLLVNILGSSTYAFSLMLMAFISGITLGSFLVSQKFIRKFDKVKLVIFCQSMIALGTMAALPFYERLPYYLWKISSYFVRNESTFPIFLTLQFFICFSMLITPTIFMGMNLPVIVEIFSASQKKIAISIGKVFSINTLGTVFGALLSGLVFIPAFGIKHTFEIGIAINIGMAIILLFSYDKIKSFSKTAFSAIAIFIFVAFVWFVPSWNTSLMVSGIFREFSLNPPATYDDFKKHYSDREILFYKEGIGANVGVTRIKDELGSKILIINGKPDASSTLDMNTQVLLGQIPMMLHQNVKNIFVVGFGSGVTIGSVLTHDINKVTCAEISPEVIEAGNLFAQENGNCLADNRLKVVTEDALTYLKLAKNNFDVIISEPSNPWIAGIGNLFSKEYFERCKTKLSDDGLMVQWFHTYEINDEIMKLILHTFQVVFPYAQLWNPQQGDIIMVGSKKPITLNAGQLEQKLQLEKVKKDFGKIKIENILTFLSCEAFSEEGFYTISGNPTVNSELHPRLEFEAPKAYYLNQLATLTYRNDERFRAITNHLLVSDYLKEHEPTNAELASALAFHYTETKNYRLSYGIAKLLNEKNPTDYKTSITLINSEEKLGMHTLRLKALEQLLHEFPDSPSVVQNYAYDKITEATYAVSFFKNYPIDVYANEILRTTPKDSISQVKAYANLANLYLENSQPQQAYEMADHVSHLLDGNKELGRLVQLDDFCYTYSASSAYTLHYKTAIEYLMGLTILNRQHPKKEMLGRMIEWRMKN